MTSKTLITYQDVEVCQLENVVLKDVNLTIHKGEFIYLLGRVGSGKSTLMKSMYAEIPISKGSATVLHHEIESASRKEVAMIRRKLGIIFQDFQLLVDRTVNDNLAFVLKATGWKDKEAIAEQIHHVLHQVGMHTKGYKMPHQLSGGEQQRIVIARALLNSPEVILADEPTGNLDPNTGKDIMELLYEITSSGTTVIVATHNLNWIEKYPGRVLLCENMQLLEVADGTNMEDHFLGE